MAKSKEMETTDSDKVQQWLLDNYNWLTEWLTNVVMISEAEAKQTPSPFQEFVAPLRMQPPHGIILAGDELKSMLIMQAVFGVGAEIANPPGKKIVSFPGFKQIEGRLPMEGDRVLFTAYKWFELGYGGSPKILNLQGTATMGTVSVLRCICTIDTLPKEVAKT